MTDSVSSPSSHQRMKGNWVQVRKHSFKSQLRQQRLAPPSKPRLWTSIIQLPTPKSNIQWKQQTLTGFMEREEKRRKVEEDAVINKPKDEYTPKCDKSTKNRSVSSKTPQPVNEKLISINIRSKELELKQQQRNGEIDEAPVDSDDDILNFSTTVVKKNRKRPILSRKRPILSRKRLKLKNDARSEIDQLLVIESDEEQLTKASMGEMAGVKTNNEDDEEFQVLSTFVDNDLLIVGRGLDIDEIIERGSSCLWMNERSNKDSNTSAKTLERKGAHQRSKSSLHNDDNSDGDDDGNEQWANGKGSGIYTNKTRTSTPASSVEGDEVMYLNHVNQPCKEKVQTRIIISSSLDNDDKETYAGSLAIEEQLAKTNSAQQAQFEVISLSSSLGDEELLNDVNAGSPLHVNTPSRKIKTHISKYAYNSSPTKTPSNRTKTYIASSVSSSLKKSTRKSKIHMSGSSCDSPPWAGFGDTFSSSPSLEEDFVSNTPSEKPLWERLGLSENPNKNHQHRYHLSDFDVTPTKPKKSNKSNNLRDLGVLSFNSLEFPSSPFDWHVDYSPQSTSPPDEHSGKLGKLGVLSFDSAEFPSPPPAFK